MSLIGETPENYIAQCQRDVRDHRAIVESYAKIAETFPEWDEVLEFERQQLAEAVERLQKARTGQYE